MPRNIGPRTIRAAIVAEALERGETPPPTERQRREARKLEIQAERAAVLRAKRDALRVELEGRVDFDREQRVNALNIAFARTLDLYLSDDLKPSAAQGLAISLGVLIDKRRLEDGEATSIHATLSADDAVRMEEMRSAATREAIRLRAVPDVVDATV